MYAQNECRLNRRRESLRGCLRLLSNVGLKQPCKTPFMRPGRFAFFFLFALLCLTAGLRAQPLAIAPEALDLGEVDVGAEANGSVDLENLHDEALSVILGISGSGFAAGAETLRLDAKGAGRVEVRFRANAVGRHVGELTLRIDSRFMDQHLSVPIQAVVVPPRLAILPAKGLGFGAISVGQAATAVVVVKNTGSTAAGDGPMKVAGLQDPFRVEGGVVPWPAPGGETRIDVTFAPTRVGSVATEMVISSADFGTWSIPLRGSGQAPRTVFSSPPEAKAAILPAGGLDFGAIPVGQAATAVVVVRNTGVGPETTGPMKIAGPQGPFRVEGGVVPWPAPGGETRIDVTFAPTRAGSVATEMVVSATDFGDWSIPLRGSGLAPRAVFSPLPRVGLDFGSVNVGQRMTRHVTVLNQGQVALRVESATIEGAAYVLGTADSPATVAPQGRFALSAAFVPRSEGPHSGVLRVQTSDPEAVEVAIPLTGRGRVNPPRIEIISGDIDFGSVAIGETSRDHLILWNRGGRAGVVEVSVAADEGAEFGLAQHSVLVQPGASARLALSFSPREAGARQAVLHVQAQGRRQTVRLQGVGRFFALSPATVDFGRVAVGESSPRVVELTNVGNADFEIHQLRLTSTEFTVNSPVDAGNTFLLPAHSQRALPLHLAFSPSSRGAVSGTLRIDGLGASEKMALDVLLKGSGVGAEIELNPAGVVDFGYAVLGEDAERTFVATNVGDTELQVEAHPQSKEARVEPAQFALAPGGSARLRLLFAPNALGERRGSVWLVSNDFKDRARPLEYKGRGVLADVDLAQIVEVLVSRDEETQRLAVGWNNDPIVQKDGTRVDVVFAIPDSLRRALIGREMVVEWTRLDENYVPKGSTKRKKVMIYESSGDRVPAEDLNLQLSEKDNRRVRLKITTRSYADAAPQSVAQLLEAGGWKFEFEARPLVSVLAIRPGREYTDADGNPVRGDTERLIGLPGLAFAGWHNVDNPSVSGIHLTAIGNVLEALSTENSLAISLGVAISFYKDQFLFGFGWDIYDNRPLARRQGSQDYIMTFKYSGLLR